MKTNLPQNADLILYEFTRPAVEAGNFQHFLDTFGMDRLPQGKPLQKYYNHFAFLFTGFDADPRELYAIPEVRAFVQSFRQAWPDWFFACNLQFTDLQAMMLCCLPSLQVARREGALVQQVQMDPREFGRFISENFTGMNQLFERAKMSEAENRKRTQQILEYYTRDWSDLARELAGGA